MITISANSNQITLQTMNQSGWVSVGGEGGFTELSPHLRKIYLCFK